MDISYHIDNDILYIAIEGRVDGSNAEEAEKMIFRIKNMNADKHVVIDAEKMAYISSAGLRLILKLRKEAPKLTIINVIPEVYEIFDLSGFTDMITVEKAYRKLNLEGCEFIAKGANGAVYRYDKETILKIYTAKNALPEIKQERENARKALILGINTAIPYGIVRVGDSYGTVTELLDAKSVTQLIRQDPEHLEQPMKCYIDMLKRIHSVEVAAGELPDMKRIALEWAAFTAEHLPKSQGNKLLSLVEAVPQRNTLLHGDYNTNNVMVQNGEPLLIDLDTLCVGHPIFELGSMFNAFIGFSETDHYIAEKFYGYTYQTSKKFWDMALRSYLGTEDAAVCQNVAEKAMIMGYTRMLRRALRRPDDAQSPARIARCKQMLAFLLEKTETICFDTEKECYYED